jgi:O-antigen ligase
VLLGRPQDLILAMQPLRPALIFTVLSAGSSYFGTKRHQLSAVFQIPETRKYILFYIIMILGIPFAFHKRMAFDYIFLTYFVNILFFLIFVLEVDSLKKLRTVFFVISLCAFFYSFFGIMKGTFYGGRFKIYGGMFDPNDIAYVLVSLFPFCFYFILHREGALKRILAVTGVIASLLVILYSGSRGGFLGLLAVVIFFLLRKSDKIKKSHKIIFVIAMVLIFFAIGDKINIDRFLTLTNIEGDYNLSSETGREQIWKRAIDLTLANPVTGVGVDCFAMAIGNLRESLGLTPVWQQEHNSYIQVAVETGLIGFIVFIALMMRCFKVFSNLKKMKKTTKEIAEIKTMASLIQLGFVGHFVAAFFLTQAYSMFFTLFFALSAVLGRSQSFDQIPNVNTIKSSLNQEPRVKTRGMLAQREDAAQSTATPMASVDKGDRKAPLSTPRRRRYSSR